jgi:hypothetical protein
MVDKNIKEKALEALKILKTMVEEGDFTSGKSSFPFLFNNIRDLPLPSKVRDLRETALNSLELSILKENNKTDEMDRILRDVSENYAALAEWISELGENPLHIDWEKFYGPFKDKIAARDCQGFIKEHNDLFLSLPGILKEEKKDSPHNMPPLPKSLANCIKSAQEEQKGTRKREGSLRILKKKEQEEIRKREESLRILKKRVV